MFLCGCNRGALSILDPEDDGQIAFLTDGFDADVFTKASVVTDSDLTSNGFLVSCVTGSAGSDAATWSNVAFSKSGSYWKGGKYWPTSNYTYRFYATYPKTYTMTTAAAGATISASNAHDIVCAYASSSTYKTANTLTFNHIFARLGNVTVSAGSGYTISGITINITPKTGGTYNLRTGAWSSTSNGSATSIANSTPGTKSNDIYLVPGTYTLTASWTATNTPYSKTFTGKTVDVALVAGKTNNITCTLTGDGTEVQFGVSLTAWSSNAIDAGTVPLVIPPEIIGGLMISAAPLYYGGSGFEIKDADWEEGLNNQKASSLSGLNNGSYFFSYSDIGSYSSVSHAGFDDWRIPSNTDYNAILGESRAGATVNGTSGVRYAGVYVESGNLYGTLLFPDGKSFSGKALGNINNEFTTYMTGEELDAYIEQGCYFIPKVKYKASGGWSTSDCYYGTSSKPSTYWYGLRINPGTSISVGYIYATSYCVPVYLVRDAN